MTEDEWCHVHHCRPVTMQLEHILLDQINQVVESSDLLRDPEKSIPFIDRQNMTWQFVFFLQFFLSNTPYLFTLFMRTSNYLRPVPPDFWDFLWLEWQFSFFPENPTKRFLIDRSEAAVDNTFGSSWRIFCAGLYIFCLLPTCEMRYLSTSSAGLADSSQQKVFILLSLTNSKTWAFRRKKLRNTGKHDKLEFLQLSRSGIQRRAFTTHHMFYQSPVLFVHRFLITTLSYSVSSNLCARFFCKVHQ